MRNIILLLAATILLASCGTTTGPDEVKTAPSNLVAFSIENFEIKLNWQDNSNVEIGFVIERKMQDKSFTIIDTVNANVEEYLDSEVELDSTYVYRVYALFQNGVSDFSNEAVINLDSFSPTELTAYATVDYEIQLNWNDRSAEELGFIISRRINGGSFTIIDTTDCNAESYLDENVQTGNEYTYRVATLFASCLSSWSNEASMQLEVWFTGLEFGTYDTFDIVTWNIEHFPKANQTTVDFLSKLIPVLDAEIYALQEIEHLLYFDSLLAEINRLDANDEWSGFLANSAYYDVNLAYIYKSNEVQVLDIYEIYTSGYYSRPFPRRPLVMECIYNNEQIWIINNHLKASGNGVLNLNDPWDEETRRYDACNLLDDYISEYLPDENVIVLGDLNDRLDDIEAHNVFWTFISKPSEYFFTDMDIALGSSAYWSYPSWPSHLDHILITNELFADFENPGSNCATILIDEYLDGGWYQYDNYISDHRPVGLQLRMEDEQEMNNKFVRKVR